MAQESEEEIVATVDNTEITMQELDQFAGVQQIVMNLYQSHQEFSQLLMQSEAGQNLINEYKKRKLENLINQKLLEKEAKTRNMSISEKEKDKIFEQHISQIKKQNNLTDEQLLEGLKQNGIKSIDQYREMFFNNNNNTLLINKLRENILNEVSVKEEEIRSYYNENKDKFVKDGENQSYEEVEDNIRKNILNSKRGEIWSDFIQELRENVNIEINM